MKRAILVDCHDKQPAEPHHLELADMIARGALTLEQANGRALLLPRPATFSIRGST